ncbi:uncharacterized protein (DUF1810 family) [Flavobacterium arsenatis]|uniref:Uncharacterized protein (DUF1810 family) n=1 Tax=Flavobacterium arsenatis TaxID=1484332 RepID=A0ABU1TSF9_9FLAO|nr:DUF1810 domain-containing protein [Flavobacterium arsenatis]MDR6968815.1 uncharacterized protein (DUF1810 family) [Flavobacterium arsenatis]
MEVNHLKKFLEAQNQVYLKALQEIKNGRKETHWMWFIFPQLKGLGQSETARFYAIADLQEATDYLAHPVLGKHLIEISEALLNIEDKSASDLFGYPDDVKLRSCMTLFANLENPHPVFASVLKRYFNGLQDEETLKLLLRNKLHYDTI